MSSSPTPADRIEAWLGILGALAGAGAWCAARLRAWRRARAAEREKREANEAASRVTFDATRLLTAVLFRHLLPPERQAELNQMAIDRWAISIEERMKAVRQRLGAIEGRPTHTPDEIAAAVVAQLRRTQEIRPADDDQPQDMFRQGDDE